MHNLLNRSQLLLYANVILLAALPHSIYKNPHFVFRNQLVKICLKCSTKKFLDFLSDATDSVILHLKHFHSEARELVKLKDR